MNLILVNADVLTMDPLKPRAEAVAILGDQIAAVGSTDEILAFKKPGTQVTDCQSLPLIPGLNDAHCHILATASSLSGLDCSPRTIGTMAELLSAVSRQAQELHRSQWIRGYGLEPASLKEKRYPNRWELDSAAPVNPVRLEHSNGHAAVLNSRALEAAGIDPYTPDPMEGVIDREPATGEPTGLLLEMGLYLRERLGSTRAVESLENDVSSLNKKLLSYGVTSVQDAGPYNGIGQWETFESLVSREKFGPRITMMAGLHKLDEFVAAGLGWAAGDYRLRLGHAKLMLGLTTGSLFPAPLDLRHLADSALAAGFPFAAHVIEREVLEAVLDLPQLGLPPAGGSPVSPQQRVEPPIPRNRIEHCAECPPMLMDKLAGTGATVVTQPGFIYWRGDNYLERVDPTLLPHLYDTAGLFNRNIPMAFGSDAPVIEPSPWPGIFSAVTSRTATGAVLHRVPGDANPHRSRGMGLTIGQALHAHTAGGAWAEGNETLKGMIRPGMLADLALINSSLHEGNPDQILQARAILTIVGGQVMWRDGTV